MLAAQLMWERTGDEAWVDAWRASADWLWDEWRGDLWEYDFRGWKGHVFGPAHGLVGNVLVLGRGDLLSADRKLELERRTLDVIARHALREDGLVQWAPSLFEEVGNPEKLRVQWCHGAPGIVASLAALAPADEGLTELLEGGGRADVAGGAALRAPACVTARRATATRS